jgi:hypothetical protein
MNPSTVFSVVIALAGVACIVFLGVMFHELSYASGHPYAYGPAKVIAWGAGAGGALALGVALLAYVGRTRAEGERK